MRQRKRERLLKKVYAARHRLFAKVSFGTEEFYRKLRPIDRRIHYLQNPEVHAINRKTADFRKQLLAIETTLKNIQKCLLI